MNFNYGIKLLTKFMSFFTALEAPLPPPLPKAAPLPLSNTADTYNLGIHGDLGVEIASATAVSRIGWRATIGFNHFGAKSTNTTNNSALDVTSGNADIVLALFRSYGVGGVLGLMIGLLILQIIAVVGWGVEPAKRPLEDMEAERRGGSELAIGET